MPLIDSVGEFDRVPIDAGMYFHHFQEEGANSFPVVLIHGAGWTHLCWPPEVRRLPGFSIYALDLLGHGKSEGMGGRQRVGDYVQDVIEWGLAQGLHRAVYIGHSMGGAIALELALNHRERVAALGLISTSARLRVLPELLADAANPTTFYKALDRILAMSFSPAASERMLDQARQRMMEIRPSVLYGDLLACDAFNVMDRLAEIEVPTLVICGTEDQMTPLRYAQYMANNIPDAQMVAIPQAGHMVMLEKPDEIAAIMADFLTAKIYSL